MGEWPLKTIGDLVTLQRGIDLPDSKRTAGDVPIMGSFGVTGFHNIAACEGPGVTVGRSGASAGTVCFIDKDYWPLNTCLYVKNFHGNDPRFSYYLLTTLNLAAYNSGSAQPSLNRNYIHPIPLRFPDVAEQRAIANALSALDDKIELNLRLNVTIEAMARAIFQDWFVDFGPVRAKIAGTPPYLAQDLWHMFPDRLNDDGTPDGWTSKALAECCSTIFSGGTPSTSIALNWGGDIPWLSSGETRATIIDKTERMITRQGVTASSTRLARSGSTVVASAGQGGTRGQASLLVADMYINQSVIALQANEAIISNHFLFLDVSRRYEELRRISDSNSSRGSLTTKLVGSLRTTVPISPIMRAHDELIEPLLKKLTINIRENRTLTETRDYLLPRLMSGKIRVADAERMVG